MAAILNVKGTDFQAKVNFKFESLANKKYKKEDKEGNETGGFMNIYMNLLEFKNEFLLAFWDCALQQHKNKPSLEEIEDALMERIDQDGDTEKLFREAFQTVDNSGFFKKQAKNFWRDFESIKGTGKTDEEKEQNQKAYDMMINRRKELTA